MKFTYKGKQTAVRFSVKGEAVVLTPNEPVEVNKAVGDELKKRNYFKALVDKGLVVVEEGKVEAPKAEEPKADNKPASKTTTRKNTK